MNQIQRIEQMEQIFDEAIAAANALSTLLPRLEELLSYYDSGQWLADYEADEAGLLPPDLKRGVLSQDGVYNLLSEYDRLMEECGRVLHEDQDL